MNLRGPPTSGPSDQARPNLRGPVEAEFIKVLTPCTHLWSSRWSEKKSSFFAPLGPTPSPCNFVLFFISPLIPPERNPGQMYQNVADIRGGNKTNNSSVRLDHLLTSEAPASPTLYTQRRRESSSPEHALKPHHIVHVHIYIQTVSPIFI